MSNEISEIVEVTDLLHARALDEFKRRSGSVRWLRDELSEISALREAAQADTEAVDARRMIGSDTLWQGWLAGRTTQLQQQMAMARALQLESLARAQKSFARLDAAREIAKAEADTRRETRARNQADRIDWLSTLAAWQRSSGT